jgi:hypothetical protein
MSDKPLFTPFNAKRYMLEASVVSSAQVKDIVENHWSSAEEGEETFEFEGTPGLKLSFTLNCCPLAIDQINMTWHAKVESSSHDLTFANKLDGASAMRRLYDVVSPWGPRIISHPLIANGVTVNKTLPRRMHFGLSQSFLGVAIPPEKPTAEVLEAIDATDRIRYIIYRMATECTMEFFFTKYIPIVGINPTDK